jgi:N-acetyl-gamma-glutamyl-phosphate reductase
VYTDAPFVRLLAAGRWPSIAGVERTNCCDIALGSDESGTHLVISSAIDNLVKGAAGQAVQCMNLRFGFDETTALGIARRTHTRAHTHGHEVLS